MIYNALKKIIALLMAVSFFAGTLVGCNNAPENSFQSPQDFENAKIGVLQGSSFDILANEYYPNSKRVYCMNSTDLILSLKKSKIDGILMDKAFYTPLIWENENLYQIPMDMRDTEYAVAFSFSDRSAELKAQMDGFIAQLNESGKMSELKEKWLNAVQPDYTPDLSLLSGENGTITFATTAENRPFAYLNNGVNTGFDIELAFMFAQEFGYRLNIQTVDFSALLSGIANQRYDMALSGITVTDERRESVNFSATYMQSEVIMIVPKSGASTVEKTRLSDYKNAKIGIITGSSHDLTARQMFPDAERVYFTSMADVILAMKQGKIDCYIEDEPFLAPLVADGNKIKRLDEAIKTVNNGFVFRQSDESKPLREKMNAFLLSLKEDGTVDRLKKKWLSETPPTEHPDYSSLTGENGTLNVAVSVDNRPLLYKYKSQCTGLEMEILTLFAKQYGYAIEIEELPFESVLSGIATGRYDIAASSLNITAEREESVDFSEPYAQFDVVMVVCDEAPANQRITSIDQLKNATIGVLTGSVYSNVVIEDFPNAKVKYFLSHADMLASLEQGKIDAFFDDITLYTAMSWENKPVIALSEPLMRNYTGMIFPKDSYDPVLYQRFNEYIKIAAEDGTLEALEKKWISSEEPQQHPDYSSLPAENGVIKVAVEQSFKPLSYRKGDAFTGFEIELLTGFAKAYGYGLELEGMSFESIIPSVSSGRCHMGASGISITEERAQSVTFSDSYFYPDGVAVVYTGAQVQENQSFFAGVLESFEKTFIREDRWKLIVQGIGVTMLISVCAAIFGTLLGFGLFMLLRTDIHVLRKIAQGVARVYSRIVSGTPVVVILMILFYVVFGSFKNISGIPVAIIGLSFTFGAFVFDHMSVSVSSVDRGQTEAAYALGYTKNQAFFRVIFPQAMKIFMPSYCSQAVELIKATAVVGYIAVNDLTKMGDIIRSNTYEAFFPLVSTAVIYFILTWLMATLLGRAKRLFEPKRRSKEDILKGVKTS